MLNNNMQVVVLHLHNLKMVSYFEPLDNISDVSNIEIGSTFRPIRVRTKDCNPFLFSTSNLLRHFSTGPENR